jgi:hypothetical protein
LAVVQRESVVESVTDNVELHVDVVAPLLFKLGTGSGQRGFEQLNFIHDVFREVTSIINSDRIGRFDSVYSAPDHRIDQRTYARAMPLRSTKGRQKCVTEINDRRPFSCIELDNLHEGHQKSTRTL